MRGLRSFQAILTADAIKALADSPHFSHLRRLGLNPVDTAGFKAMSEANNLTNLNWLMMLCPETVEVKKATATKFANRSAFPNLGQVWFGGAWGKDNLAPLLKSGSVPWVALNQEPADDVGSKQLEKRQEKLGGCQAPLDERFEQAWDGE